MSILQYFQKDTRPPTTVSLPDPRGALSRNVPPAAIASANAEIRRCIATSGQFPHGQRRRHYNSYTPEQKATIGRFAVMNGVMAAKRRYSAEFRFDINESTVRRFKEAYLKERRRKRELEDGSEIKELHPRKRGRKVVLGEKMDAMVMCYIRRMREKGCVINTAIVKAGARGILMSQDRTRLAEFGGPATLTTAWAKSLLKRMNFTQRRGTTKAKVSVADFSRRKTSFLQEIVDVVSMEEIPMDLIFNWDQTGLNLVPVSSWTMAAKGSKRIEVQGLTDKRQITGVFCGTLVGEFLPIQLIYGGKTSRCLPPYKFPSDWLISHTKNHWSNEDTMISYVENIIVPFIRERRALLGVGEDHAALAIFDHFKGQLTEKVIDCLEKHNIQSVLVPANCTDRLQPLDISVNKAAKAFLRSQFQEWYANEVLQLYSDTAEDDDNIEPVDLSTPRMKCIGGQWMVKLFEYMSDNPALINNGFQAAHIPQSIDAGKPMFEEEEDDGGECSSDVDDTEESDSN